MKHSFPKAVLGLLLAVVAFSASALAIDAIKDLPTRNAFVKAHLTQWQDMLWLSKRNNDKKELQVKDFKFTNIKDGKPLPSQP